MKPIKFKQSNTDFGVNQTEYNVLPAHLDKEKGIVTSCWKLSLYDRLMVFFGGVIYLQILSNNKPLQPQLLTVDNPIR